jgi:hypothetical protein
VRDIIGVLVNGDEGSCVVAGDCVGAIKELRLRETRLVGDGWPSLDVGGLGEAGACDAAFTGLAEREVDGEEVLSELFRARLEVR